MKRTTQWLRGAFRSLGFITPNRIKRLIYYIKCGQFRIVANRALRLIKASHTESINTTIYLAPSFSKQLIFESFSTPLVSIIVPVFNEWKTTKSCLVSILENTNGIDYEVIIADDCSTDITANLNLLVKNVRVISNKTNLGFLKNCNCAAYTAQGKYIVLLNNDTNVQPNWLSTLLSTIQNDDTIGIVGSMLLYPDGRVQEAGGIILQDGSGWNYGHLGNPESPEYNYKKEVDYVSGACLLIPKTLWNDIGGFDETFCPAYYEDVDLAFEVRKRNLKVVYQPLSRVVHFEGVSHGNDISSGIKANQKNNQLKFYEKWRETLKSSHSVSPDKLFFARDRSQNKKILLFIDNNAPLFDQDAGSKITFQYLTLFIELGYNVKYIADDFINLHPYTSSLQQLGIEVFYGSKYRLGWTKWLKINGESVNYVCLARPAIAEKYLPLIKKHTTAKIIYFGLDLHYLREIRHHSLDGSPARLKAALQWEKKELAILGAIDVAYFYSDYEVLQINKKLPNVTVRTIPFFLIDNQHQQKTPTSFERRKGLLFVGGFLHEPNIDGILWFINDIYPLIRQVLPEIELTIIGASPPEKLLRIADNGIKVAGRVSDCDLSNQYENCRVIIAPLRFGAGIKGKIIEAMLNGIPTVTTSIGAEGIKNSSSALIIADTPKLFAKLVVDTYTNKSFWETKREAALQAVKNHISKSQAKEILSTDMPIL